MLLNGRPASGRPIDSFSKLGLALQRPALQPAAANVGDAYRRSIGDHLFGIGKYRGMCFSEVYAKHPDYVGWARGLPEPFGQIKEFIAFCSRMDAANHKVAAEKAAAQEEARRRMVAVEEARRAAASTEEARRKAAGVEEARRRAAAEEEARRRLAERQRHAAMVAAARRAAAEQEAREVREAMARSLEDQRRDEPRRALVAPPAAPKQNAPPAAPLKVRALPSTVAAPSSCPPTKARPPGGPPAAPPLPLSAAPAPPPSLSAAPPLARVSVASLGLADGDAIEVKSHLAEASGIEKLVVWWPAHVRLQGGCLTSREGELTLCYAAMHGFDAEERRCQFLEGDEGSPGEGMLLDVTDSRQAEKMHWRRATGGGGGPCGAAAAAAPLSAGGSHRGDGWEGGSSEASAAEPAVSTLPGMCRARCANGKPCRNRVHKHAGKAEGHRAHTCGVHKAFTAELLPVAPAENLGLEAIATVDATPRTQPSQATRGGAPPASALPHSPPPPPPHASAAEQAAAEQAAAEQAAAEQAAAQLQALEERAQQAEERARRRSLELKHLAQALLEKDRRLVEQQRAAAVDAVAEMIAPPPPTWTPCAASATMAMVPLERGSDEWRRVVCHFEQSAGAAGSVRVISVDRVQNPSLWQPYQLRRREVMQREKATEGTMRRYERTQLYHGTDAATAAKIASMGFNRSFSGKHACRLGKGCYFARHAGYSINPLYASPDEHGHQRVFCCRVLVGEYAVGAKDVPAPPVRRAEPHLLYDSTVDRLVQPEIFVTFHDAAAYPEYLIQFDRL